MINMPTMDIMGEDVGNFKTKMKAVFFNGNFKTENIIFYIFLNHNIRLISN